MRGTLIFIRGETTIESSNFSWFASEADLLGFSPKYETSGWTCTRLMTSPRKHAKDDKTASDVTARIYFWQYTDLIEFACDIWYHVELDHLEDDCERNYNEASDEVDTRQSDYEYCRDELIATAAEHPQDDGISGRSNDDERQQQDDNGIELDATGLDCTVHYILTEIPNLFGLLLLVTQRDLRRW